jgi:aminopeptidase
MNHRKESIIMKKSRLKKYAALIAGVGVNVRKGQEVIINAELDQPEFVRLLVEECYKAGAKKVTVEWGYQPLTKLHVKYRSLKTLSALEEWEIEKLRHRAKTLPAVISLMSEDPDGLAGINQEKFAKATQAKYPVIKPLRDEMENKYQWCIAAVPGEKWAKKIFPNETKKGAVEKLWEAILFTSRVDDDPVKAWREHNAFLQSRCDYLNSLDIEALEYKASNGTNLKVGLIPNSMFCGGGETTLGGRFFNPNIPTEEVFITPKRGLAEGVVFSSKPFSYKGEIIDKFSIRFENGKAVEVHAEKNEELLRTMISMDEGAAYLGECAFVPFHSPINDSGLLFFNTLFDENASCHLALGEGFVSCIRDYQIYSLRECRDMGINDSMIHEDIMIGTEDLSVTALTRDGRRVMIFKDGNWAF